MSAPSAGIPQLLEDAVPVQSGAERPRSDLLPGCVRSHQRQVQTAGLQESLLNSADATDVTLCSLSSGRCRITLSQTGHFCSVVTLFSHVDPPLNLSFNLSLCFQIKVCVDICLLSYRLSGYRHICYRGF